MANKNLINLNSKEPAQIIQMSICKMFHNQWKQNDENAVKAYE